MGAGYQVGCGSSHIWLRRLGFPTRLAIIADRLTTTCREGAGTVPSVPTPAVATGTD